MAEDRGLVAERQAKLVEEYVYIARHMRVPEYVETHDEQARTMLRQPGGEMQLQIAIRRLWGKD